MMSEEQRSGAAETEGGFRERLLHAVLRWRQRVAGNPSSPTAVILREMAELRATAQARGWPTAQHLLYLENIAQTAPLTLSQALSTIENLLRVANVPVSDRTVPLVQADQRSPRGVSVVLGSEPPRARLSPSSPVSPAPTRPSDSIAPPPLIGGSALPVAALPTALPDSHLRPRPPTLLKSILGLSAKWKKPDARHEAPPSASGARPSGGGIPSPRKGLFAFRAISSEAARPVPTPIPARPGFGSNRPASWRPRASENPPLHRGAPGLHAQGLPAAPEPAVPRWFYALIGLVGLLGVATIGTIIALGRRPRDTPEPNASSSVATGTSTPIVETSTASPAARAAVTTTWKKPGTQTSELLRALLDLQGKLASSCRDDSTSCGGRWTPLAREALTPVDVKDLTPSSADAPLPAWLKPLTLPHDMPVRDELALRNSFNFHTRHTVGRPAMQAMLFECSAYSDIFKRTFIQYGAPPWLAAVAFQESGCNPRATSPVGAKGLWQFMPESARIYGLRVTEGDVDERLNPVKSTDAAVHFLTDLERMLGAWDLTLAAYNMGPFAIVKRLEQLGGNVGFWDLVHAHVLPEETAGYVPAIEAYALVLDNLSLLKFSRDGKRPEGAEEVNVKAGTRLSLIARAASTTTARIRELNPEFLRDVVPEGETTARVPDTEAYRAQAFLDTWARNPDDNRDTCVPENFDWGAKQFERSEYAKSCGDGR
jgi:hypothetical protein